MERSHFQLVATIGIILGALLLAGGTLARSYSTMSGSPPAMLTYVYPYAAYSGILFGARVVLIFIGIAAVLLGQQIKQAHGRI